jgi:hypothetical protein
MADANNIIVDNTIIDYSTINNMVSSLKDLQSQILSLKNVVMFNKEGTTNQSAVGDIKIEALTKTFSVLSTTTTENFTFATKFASPPTVNLSIQSQTDTKAKPTMLFSIDASTYKVTVNISGLTANSQYTIHAIAIGA